MALPRGVFGDSRRCRRAGHEQADVAQEEHEAPKPVTYPVEFTETGKSVRIVYETIHAAATEPAAYSKLAAWESADLSSQSGLGRCCYGGQRRYYRRRD